jgi:peptide chain release factor 3
MGELENEIARRRTFAIISHPDAGKTTLTEKLLLYGGALRLAGSVTARKQQRDTASDWMELEKKRGISISSTVLQFDYGSYRLNLLDTPGHKDFSEDTYRVLMAVDAVIMVIDAGKGIESQTRKLFEICRKRGVPLFTFMNKLDRPIRPPLELIDELESVLHIHAFPVNWPLGMGIDFKGVYDRLSRQAHLFERVQGGAYRAPVTTHTIADLEKMIDPTVYRQAVEELELLDGAHAGFDPAAVLEGITTPVFFGSAGNNFGVELLLNGFLGHSCPPKGRQSSSGKITPSHKKFSGFIFKIQTNMDPLHRDQVAFLRICSGKFARDMEVIHPRNGKKVKLTNSHKVFGQDREIVDSAYPGDIIGVVGRQDFRIGDTLSEDRSIQYHEIPRFAPECFGHLTNPNPAQYKPFRKGLEHLLSESIVQVFDLENMGKSPLFGAVGPLQFEVLQYRLKSEYGADSQLDMAPWSLLRWVETELQRAELDEIKPYDAQLARDDQGKLVMLFASQWSLDNFANKHPEVALRDTQLAAPIEPEMELS